MEYRQLPRNSQVVSYDVIIALFRHRGCRLPSVDSYNPFISQLFGDQQCYFQDRSCLMFHSTCSRNHRGDCLNHCLMSRDVDKFYHFF